ncbi:hypothetical protein RCL_jg25751.t1 [Rhizophagus clarus]|uniref:Uncharacterized protein n=1 Tax=Rhizophagus clarus TaxID=94130 RepID=A0A8H3LV99_9GLOM|nr:hypothetical protein RCL_jg25751.t1 [Rhizophagus clarus]
MEGNLHFIGFGVSAAYFGDRSWLTFKATWTLELAWTLGFRGTYFGDHGTDDALSEILLVSAAWTLDFGDRLWLTWRRIGSRQFRGRLDLDFEL